MKEMPENSESKLKCFIMGFIMGFSCELPFIFLNW